MEAWYAHCALHKFNILPSVFAELPENERIFIIGSIIKEAEDSEKARDDIKNKRKHRR